MLLVTALAAALAASARPALGAEGDCCSPALLRAFGDASKEFGEELKEVAKKCAKAKSKKACKKHAGCRHSKKKGCILA